MISRCPFLMISAWGSKIESTLSAAATCSPLITRRSACSITVCTRGRKCSSAEAQSAAEKKVATRAARAPRAEKEHARGIERAPQPASHPGFWYAEERLERRRVRAEEKPDRILLVLRVYGPPATATSKLASQPTTPASQPAMP